MSQNLIVGIASEAHSNQTINTPSAEATLEITKFKGGYPFIDSLLLYIPQNLDIDEFLQQNPPNFNYCKDRFVYILSLIYSIPSRKKSSVQDYSGYTPINKVILSSIIKDYRKYIDYLKVQGIVEEDNYVVGEKSGGLRFTTRFRSIIRPVEITSWTLIKNIMYLRKNYNSEKTQDLMYLKKWFNNGLQIDIEGATNYLMQEYRNDLENPDVKFPMVRLNSRLYPIENLHRLSNPLFFVDNTAGRLHTYLTQLKSELRKYIKYDDKTLCSVDIVNCQPYLCTALLSKNSYVRNNIAQRVSNTNPIMEPDSSILIMLGVLIDNISQEEDVLEFRRIVASGRFYEEFGRILIQNGEIDESENIREHVKEITFSTFFSKNSSERYINSIKVFKRTFRNVYEVFRYIKHSHHPTLAVILQNLEADLILHKACKIIAEERPDVFIATLHDSIITTEDNVEYVKSIMYNVLRQNIGIAPALKIERWE